MPCVSVWGGDHRWLGRLVRRPRGSRLGPPPPGPPNALYRSGDGVWWERDELWMMALKIPGQRVAEHGLKDSPAPGGRDGQDPAKQLEVGLIFQGEVDRTGKGLSHGKGHRRENIITARGSAAFPSRNLAEIC